MRVDRERVATDADPLAVLDALDGDLLLAAGDRGWPATVVAADPVDRFRYHRGDDRSDGADGSDGAADDCFAALRDWLPPSHDVDTHCGAYGFVGYDVWQELEDVEGTAERDVALPDAALGLYDTVAVVEDDAVVVEAVDCAASTAPAEDRLVDWRDRIADGSSPALERPSGGTVSWSIDQDGYTDAVRGVQDRIRAGETFQANISRRASFDSAASAPAVHARLRETNPAPYAAIYDPSGADWGIASSSPELLVRVDGDAVTTRPIAGTRPRGAAAGGAEDDAVAEALRGSAKERAEHSILVDLARNDVGAVCRPGTVVVDDFMEAVPYAAVTHLESVVSGRLAEGNDAVDALRSCFPGGTVTGAPKPRTLRIIDGVEPVERGPYTGSLGRVTFGGDACFNILIRSVVIDGDRHHVQVGGGVVHDSDPAAEYRETGHKARAVLAAYDGIASAEEAPRADVPPAGPESSSTGRDDAKERAVGEDALEPVRRDRPRPLGADVTVAVVDNHDSFAHNLAQGLGRHCTVEVGRYEEPPDADGVVFSPGPGRPEEFPVMEAVLDREDGTPVLGVCLGHQAIATHFGGSVARADEVVHGKTSSIDHDGEGVFAGLPRPMTVGRYHSLVVERVPASLAVVARGADEVMAVRHADRPLHGVQFHPESFLTPSGERLLRNFVALVEAGP